MVRWVVDALQGSGRIGTIVLVGLGPEDGVAFTGSVVFQAGGGTLLDNMLSGLDRIVQLAPEAERAVLCAADVPLLTPEVVRYFVDECLATDHDLYYSIVEESVMEAQFPGSGRTFLRLKEGRFTGGDLYMLRIAAARANVGLARQIMEERKNYWRQARLIGLGPLVKLALHRLTLADAERVAGRALKLRGRAVVSRYAALGMDADKPHQLVMVEEVLRSRESRA
jgi:hypothetical protein